MARDEAGQIMKVCAERSWCAEDFISQVVNTCEKLQSWRATWLNLSSGQLGKADQQKEKDTIKGNWERTVIGHERNDEVLIWEGGRRDRKERVKSHCEVDSLELSGGLDWEGENGSQGWLKPADWAKDDPVMLKNVGIRIGWVGQREHDFGHRHVVFHYFMDSHMEVTRGQCNTWSNLEHKWGLKKNTNQSEDDQALVWRVHQDRFWSKSRCIYCWEELVPWTLRVRNQIQVYMASQFQYLEKVMTKKFNSKNLKSSE